MFKVHFNDAKTIKWWFSRRNSIDMDPPYQRKGGIWSTENKAYLIDSIINEYDIPKIYLADFSFVDTSLNIKKKQYAVIDGKQRLQAIFGFFLNEFSLNSDFIYYTDKSLKLGGLYYKDLQVNYSEIASIYEEFNLHVMSVITDDELRINDLFVRLNTSKPLTGAEIRNAMKGKIPEAIRKIARHSFFRENISFSTTRGQDRNTAAKILLIEFRGKFVDIKRTNLDRFVEEGEKMESANIDRAIKRVNMVLNSMRKMFVKNDPILASEGFVPVLYWIVRELGEHDIIREFIVHFEQDRKRNREISKKTPDKADQELLQYDILNRSTNDQNSLFGRYTILVSKLEKELESAL